MGVLVSQSDSCPLCGRAFGDEPVFNFTHVKLEHPRLAVLDDWAVHRSCLQQWELRDAFVAAWNARAEQSLSRTWMLVRKKDGTLDFAADPRWHRILDALLHALLYPVFRVVELARRAYCHVVNVDPLTGQKRAPKCKNCGNRLFTPNTKQCLQCGMDWHNPEKITFRETESSTTHSNSTSGSG